MGIISEHPSEFIQEELNARGWDLDDLAIKMDPSDFVVTRLVLDIYFIVGPERKDCRIGDKMAEQMSKAFGVSKDLFINLENSWLRNQDNA